MPGNGHNWHLRIIKIGLTPTRRHGGFCRRKKTLIFGVGHLIRGQFEGIQPHAMDGLLIVAAGVAPHQEPLLWDSHHERFDKTCHWLTRWTRLCRCGRHVALSKALAEFILQMPVIFPESSTSIEAARETFGRPGINIILPEITTTKPAPAESEAFVTLRVQPVGAPSRLGSSDKEYCVLAMHTGK